MVNIQKLIEEENKNGYQGDKASAKVCQDIVRRLKNIFSDKSYVHRLDASDKRWIDEEIDVVTDGLLEFVSNT